MHTLPNGWTHFPDCAGGACDCGARHAQNEAFLKAERECQHEPYMLTASVDDTSFCECGEQFAADGTLLPDRVVWR